MNDDEAWFLAQGFRTEIILDGANLFWADLVNVNNPQGRAPRYGRGTTPQEAIRRARQRYETEQIGDSEH